MPKRNRVGRRCEHCGAGWTLSALTKRQCEIYLWIRDYIEEHDEPPTYREIGAGIGVKSESSVFEHVENLERAGFLLRTGYNSTRSIQILVELPGEVES